MALMHNKNIMGKYNVSFPLNRFTSNFTFQNNDRYSTISPQGGDYIAVLQLNAGSSNPIISFIKNNKLKIKRGIIYTFGAEGLRAGFKDTVDRNIAALINLTAVRQNQLSDDFGQIELEFPKYNEWIDFNFDFLVNQNIDTDFYYFKIASYSYLTIDDYNIKTNYIGQSFVPRMVLEIESAGVWDVSNPYNPI